MKLSIIILTYNSETHISECLQSIIKETANNSEIIVIDNNSSDKTIKTLRKKKFKLKIIQNHRNLGFSTGINIGIKEAKREYVLIINPDTIIAPGAIKKLLECSKHYKAGIVGGKLLKKNKGIHGSFVRKPELLTGIFDFTNLRKIIPYDYFHNKHYYLNEKFPVKAREVDAVSGACMLIKKCIFNDIGYFDEKFFMYLEDVDFCIRAKQAGYKIIFCPNSNIFHEGGSSSANKDKINYAAWSSSRRYYFKKNFSTIENMIIQPLFVLDDVISTIWRKIR